MLDARPTHSTRSLILRPAPLVADAHLKIKDAKPDPALHALPRRHTQPVLRVLPADSQAAPLPRNQSGAAAESVPAVFSRGRSMPMLLTTLAPPSPPAPPGLRRSYSRTLVHDSAVLATAAATSLPTSITHAPSPEPEQPPSRRTSDEPDRPASRPAPRSRLRTSSAPRPLTPPESPPAAPVLDTASPFVGRCGTCAR